MSIVQIYYVYNDKIKKKAERYGVDLDTSVRRGDKTIDEVYDEIKSDPKFCREETSIRYSHFLSIIRNNITLYADLDGKIAGALSFVFNIKDGNNVIMFEGICSPEIYTRQGVGQELINTLIRIGKQYDIKYIFLECRGDIMKYYRKFGFEIMEKIVNYDSDDEEDTEPYYYMKLDLSKVSGGKMKKKSLKRKNKKRVSSTRKRRKLRKI